MASQTRHVADLPAMASLTPARHVADLPADHLAVEPFCGMDEQLRRAANASGDVCIGQARRDLGVASG